MNSISDRFEFNTQLEVYLDGDSPKMELIRLEPQVSALMRDNPEDIQKYLFVLLSGLNDSFKVNPEFKLTEDEIIDLIMSLTKSYFHYRVQDFAIFVKNAKLGRYGKSYNRIDVPTIHEWFKKYDQERLKVIESNHSKNKPHDHYERGADAQKIEDNPEFRKVLIDYKKKHNEID